MTIVEFLLARIAEDERCANNARGLLGVETAWHEADVLRQRGLTRADAQHMARWSARRVLAECQAKRAIIEREVEEETDYAPPQSLVLGDQILEHLAAVYADHPDHNPKWRP